MQNDKVRIHTNQQSTSPQTYTDEGKIQVNLSGKYQKEPRNIKGPHLRQGSRDSFRSANKNSIDQIESGN